MKMSRIATGVFGAALLFCSSAFAQETKGKLHLDETLTVAGTRLNPGDYKVEWKGDGPDAQVSLVKGKQAVATFPARITEQAIASNNDAYGSTEQPNGTKTLNAIYFSGKRYVVQVEGAATAQHNPQDNAPSK